MKSLADIRRGPKTRAELEAEKLARDVEVQRLRAEMAELHSMLEPFWAEQQRLTAGLPELRQMFTPGRSN